jgi:hypothetical protein
MSVGFYITSRCGTFETHGLPCEICKLAVNNRYEIRRSSFDLNLEQSINISGQITTDSWSGKPAIERRIKADHQAHLW